VQLALKRIGEINVQTITNAGYVRPGDILISVNGHSAARGVTVDEVEITPLGDVRIFGTKHNSTDSKLIYRGIRQNLQVVVQRTTRPANALDVAPAVELSVRQIRRDIANGRVPSTVRDFSQLHDYVDANEYGGLCDDTSGIDWTNDDDDAGNTVQNKVNALILAGVFAEVNND